MTATLNQAPVARSLARYRWAVASRCLAASVGAYALAAAAAAFLAQLLLRDGVGRSDAVAIATMLAFVLQLCGAIWVFAVASAWKAWGGIVVPAALLALGLWLYGGAA